MKKVVSILYIVLCLSICIVPFAGMTVAKTDTTTENRNMAEFPEWRHGRNAKYLSELGNWFEDHFAFRPQLVMADSVIQSKVFRVSNMDTVLVGTDGWLYYASTLPDYLGIDCLSKRGIWNVAHNLFLAKQSVEDAFIETKNASGNGSLLMFRDSFGNTLLPLMANTFETAYFSKGVPYNLGDSLKEYHPEYVIMEKVERNIADFATNPPIMEGPERKLPENGLDVVQGEHSTGEVADDITMVECEYNTGYWQISGQVTEELPADSRIYIALTTADGKVKVYEAYSITTDMSDYGFLLYLQKESLLKGKVQVQVLTQENETITLLIQKTFDTSFLAEPAGE